jgi:hypothetical protein
MSAVSQRSPSRVLRPVLLRETRLNGEVGGERYTASLTVSLTADTLTFEPAGFLGRPKRCELPLDALILAHLHPGRLAPRIDLYYHTRRGTGSCTFSPRDLRLWAQYLGELGVLLRPHPVDLATLPSRNLAYRARAALLATLTAGGVVGVVLALTRFVHGG